MATVSDEDKQKFIAECKENADIQAFLKADLKSMAAAVAKDAEEDTSKSEPETGGQAAAPEA